MCSFKLSWSLVKFPHLLFREMAQCSSGINNLFRIGSDLISFGPWNIISDPRGLQHMQKSLFELLCTHTKTNIHIYFFMYFYTVFLTVFRQESHMWKKMTFKSTRCCLTCYYLFAAYASFAHLGLPCTPIMPHTIN